MTSATMAGTMTAAPQLLLTWRCWSCRRIVAKLTYDGGTIIEVRHHCHGSPMNRLPDHVDRLRAEDARR